VRGKLSARLIEQIRVLRRAGFSYGEIAERLGVSKETAWKHGRDMETPSKPSTSEPREAKQAQENLKPSKPEPTPQPEMIQSSFAQLYTEIAQAMAMMDFAEYWRLKAELERRKLELERRKREEKKSSDDQWAWWLLYWWLLNQSR